VAKTRTKQTRPAEIVREYGPYPGIEKAAGVTFDGAHLWIAHGDGIAEVEPESGALARDVRVAADAGTAFDGTYLWQIADTRIQKIDPATGAVVATIPAPGKGGDSGLTWAEGTLWVGEYRARKIHEIEPATGKILRTIESDRFVTGVTWVDGELWHATLESDQSDLRRIDPETGDVLDRLEMPAGALVSGLEADGRGAFYCGGAGSGKVRVVRKP
jgi:glutamine cyclotransferase